MQNDFWLIISEGNMQDRLKIISADNPQSLDSHAPKNSLSKRAETQAKFDRLWLTEAEQFDTLRNCMERDRISRTWHLIASLGSTAGKSIVDLGCGGAVLAKKLAAAAEYASLEAVDISKNALKIAQAGSDGKIKFRQDYLPHTSLEDNHYDLVISTELIGYIPAAEHRLYMSELARLVKPNGFVLCSTALDINTEDAVQVFGALAETEFNIEKWKFSYHALYIQVSNFFKSPERFSRGWKDRHYRKQQMGKRKGFSKWWYTMNSAWAIGWLWNGLQYAAYPFAHQIENNQSILLGLEKICRFLWAESGITHAIFLGKRRPLIKATAEELLAIEPKHKRQVWE